MRMEIAADVDGFTVRPRDDEPWWHDLWLPFGGDAGGSAMVIDLRHGPGHLRLGFAGHAGGGLFDDGWPSLEVYLAETADALEHGGHANAWPLPHASR
jgi:hypothetical protein